MNATAYSGAMQPRIHFDSKLNQYSPLSNQIVSYSNSLDDSRHLFQLLNIPGRFGEHSGRRGGATAAAQNGACVADLQQLGNWKSSSCALKYVDNDPTKQEKISKLLYPRR